MRKKELVHVHALLQQVREELQESGPVPADAFDAYEEYGVAAAAVHHRKADHRTAIFELADGLTTTIETREGEQAADEPSTGLRQT